MKIFMIADSMDIGGAETHIYELSRLLSSWGHRVTVISSGGRLARRLARVGVRHLTVPGFAEPFGFFASVGMIGRWIRRDKPHVVHAHTRRAAFACRLLRAKLSFPFAVTAHAMFSAGIPQKVLSFFPPSTVAVSEDIRRRLTQVFSVPDAHITVIPNGVNTRRFAPGAPYDGPLTVMFVSRLDRDCSVGAKLLCRCAPQLRRKLGRPFRIVIVGGGQIEGELRAMAERVNTAMGEKCVIVTGARSDVAHLLERCHIFVGVSRAALEAMSAGKAVILCGDEGYLGIVRPSTLSDARKSNFCARGFGAPEASRLMADILYLANCSREEREALGRWGRQTVCRHYSAEGMAKATEALYRREIARFREARRADAVICGYYGYGNCGDELALGGMVECLRSLSPHIRLAVMTADGRAPKGTKGICRYDLLAVARELRGTGALLLGGGSLLQDATSRRSLIYYLSVLYLAQRMGVPTMLYANGIGPLSPEGERLCRRVLSGVDVISLRDRASFEAVRAMRLPRTVVIHGADPVLGKSRQKERSCTALPYIAVFPRGRAAERARDILAEGVAALAKARGCGVTVTAMCAAEDGAAVERMAVRLRQFGVPRVVETSAEPHAIERLIAGASTVISQRLHAVILAFAYGVPAIGVEHDPKISAFLRDVGAPFCVVPKEPTVEQLARAAACATVPPLKLRHSLRRRALRDARIANRLIFGDGNSLR